MPEARLVAGPPQLLSVGTAPSAILVADQFTLADLCYIPFLHFLPLMDVEAPSNVARWAAELAARPSAKATLPPM